MLLLLGKELGKHIRNGLRPTEYVPPSIPTDQLPEHFSMIEQMRKMGGK